MKPLLLHKQGFVALLLICSFFTITLHAQNTDEDLQKMGKDAKGFIFKLKFNGTSNVSPGDVKYAKITALLEKYKAQVPAGLQQPFKVKGTEAGKKPNLDVTQQSSLKSQANQFFREMAAQGLTVQDLQRYKEVFKNKNPKPGDNPVDPKIAWEGEFEGIERTLMGGRTIMIMDVWKQTLLEHFKNYPEAVGVIYGQMDIGSWVKMNVDGLGFASDIDFSTIATDAATNKALHNLFAENLKKASGLGMIPIDVVHTSHGLAGSEVFIGEWGKAFAEVDMLRRGKWKLLQVVKNEKGQITDIKTVEKEGKELFIEKGMEQELKVQQKDPANNFDPKERYPELKIDMEPMLSLEMLRHAIHDIEHGPFQGGQKIIKMIKYTERSFFMMDEAGKNIPVEDAKLYFNLSPDEQFFKTLCDQVIKNKGDAKKIALLLETFTGKKLDHNDQVNLIVDDIVEKSKKAMLKNANQAFGYRFRLIAQIEDEGKRFEESEKFLKQIEEEIKKGFEDGKTKVPETMLRSRFLLSELRAGRIPPGEVDAKLRELNDLMEKEYQIDKSFVERWVGDTWNSVKKFFIERGYGLDAAQKLVINIKEKVITEWKNYAPDNLQKATTTMYEKTAWVNTKLNSFNEHMAKSKPGKILSSEMLNQADNAFALYDAWLSGKTPAQSAWRVSWTAGTIWAQGRWPFLAIPLGIYNSLETKSVAPAAMAVAFYLFPMAGQVYMVTNLIDRIIISNVRDMNFRMHLDRLAVMAITDGQGHVIRFKVPRAFTGLTGSPDSLETEPDIAVSDPARTEAIKTVFYNPEFLYCPDIKYFISLIPRRNDQYGLYDTKLKNLMTLFAFDNDFVGYLIGVNKFKEEKENGTLPNDVLASDRLKMIDSLELVIENKLWSAVFTAIESTKKAEKEGVVKELEATIVRIQDSLFMDEYSMKKIDSLSLLLKIRKEIQNDPLYQLALKDKLSAGNAYERVAIPTFERYIYTYRLIPIIQNKIFEIWKPFGVDASKMQVEPMRLLLMGGLSGAPMLTTNTENDFQIAIQCQEAHTNRAATIRMNLANALGRPIKENDKEDKEHLRILGEYGFGFEHLVDQLGRPKKGDIKKVVANINFGTMTEYGFGVELKDDPDENGGNPVLKEEHNVVIKAMREKVKMYKDYLEKLKEVPSLLLKLKMKGEQVTMETNPLKMEASVIDANGKETELPKNVSIEWYLDADGKQQKAGDGASLTNPADQKGNFYYIIKLVEKKNDQLVELNKVNWNIVVKPYDLNDASKGIKLILPTVIKQYDIIDVSAKIPEYIKSKVINCSWDNWVIEKSNDCSSAKLQINSVPYRKNTDGTILYDDSVHVGVNIEMPVPEPSSLMKTYETNIGRNVKFQPLSLNMKATDVWEGGFGADWLNLKRKTMKTAERIPPWSEDKKPQSTGTAYATMTMNSDNYIGNNIKTLEELRSYFEKTYDLKQNKGLVLKSFNIGDFKGYSVYNPPIYSPGHDGFELKGAGASASFDGIIMKGKIFFKVNWVALAGCSFDNYDKIWVMNTVKMLEKECEAMLSSLTFHPDGSLTKSPYKGPKLDGSDYPQVSIEPKVDTIQPGSKVSVKAVIKNDKAEYGPYTYTWSGNTNGNSNGTSVELNADRPGKQSVTISVDGTTPPGSASMEYVVAPLKVRLIKISPATNKIIVGMPVELRAEFISAIPAGKKLQYLWQPHPEEKFEPYEGENNTTKVVFTKPGNKRIWVQVLDKTTAETITMGESEQLEFVVEKPGFTISFNPPKAVIGQQVTAKITSIPGKLEEVSYRWLPLPSNAKQVKESQDGSEIIFYAKNAMQIPFEVLSLVKGSGEELGKTKSYFNAERYNVKAEGPKVQGPKPMIWKPGVGLVEVDKEIAVHQVVEYSAVITPQPTSSLTYEWKVTQGNASISNPISKDARITALETGTIQVNVTVKDNNGVELGTAVGVFNATISNEMITNGTKQKKEFDNNMLQARQLIKDGKLDDAIKLGEEIKGMNAKDAVPLMNELAIACKKAAKDASNERNFELAIKRCEQALIYNPNDAAAKTQLDQNKKWLKEWPSILAKGNEIDANIQKKNVPASYKSLMAINDLQFNMPGQMANKWSQEKSSKYNVLSKACDSAYQKTQSIWTDDFKKNDWEDGLKILESFKGEWTAMEGSMKNINSSIQTCKQKITEQTKLYTDFQEDRSKFEQGIPLDSKQTTFYFTVLAYRFCATDPRQKEILDFANGMDKKQKEIIANKDKATQLKKDGIKAEAAGQKDEALKKYKESVALIPDADITARIKKLETEVATVQIKKNKADELWNEGEKLVKKKKTRDDGLSKMKESFEWWNSPERIEKVRDIEKEVNGTVSNTNISGVWKHGKTETFTFTSSGDGLYTATEKGFDNAKGTVTMMGQTGIINYTTKDGTTGQYILKLSADGSSAVGKWADSRNTNGERNFTRISKPDNNEPDITKVEPKKKKKSFNDILDNINKGFNKFDSTLSGKKPTDKKNPDVITIPEDKGVDPADATKEEKIFDNGNSGNVSSGPTRPTSFVLSKTTYITRIENYHYFNNGTKPGTISLQNNKGQKFGPWQAYGILGQSGVQNAFWVVQPKIQLPAGTYRVIDSDPSTWSYNSQSQGGFSIIWEPKVTKPPADKKGPDITNTKGKTEGSANTETKISTGTIFGSVYRPDGVGAAGATINAGDKMNATTNKYGQFIIYNVPAGKVTVNVSYNNHHNKTYIADLSADQTLKLIFYLTAD
ncbi:MAG: carboxypeptidase-like regulatory domain-containing protein [Chitinophagaceae bacterium]